jgi:hypothetical protein
MSFLAIDRRGTSRLVICIGKFAVKIARNAEGRRCNLDEAKRWRQVKPKRRTMLCPVLATAPYGVALMMPRARPTSQAEADWLLKTGGYPDWDYDGIGDEGHPFEWSAGDWGWLDGKLVALDYAAPEEPPPADDTNRRSERKGWFGR